MKGYFILYDKPFIEHKEGVKVDDIKIEQTDFSCRYAWQIEQAGKVVHSLPLSLKSELYPSDLFVKGTLALNIEPQREVKE